MQSESSKILEGAIAGDDIATKQLFDRYVNRLVALARSHLSKSLQSRVDAEDVVQSAFRSFFRKIQDQETVLLRSADLWRYLAAITRNKVLKRVEFELAQKRNPASEVAVPAHDLVVPATDPGVEEVVILIDEIMAFAKRLPPRDQTILELRLQGDSIEEIALAVGISEATVRRVLGRVGDELQRRLQND